MDLLDGLNAPQREAVLHESGPLLIFAGAGSGKTRTLTHRIAHLIEQGVPAPRILAVTFTNKAAKEMRERLHRLVANDSNRLWMGTFHALCAQMLRMNGGLIGIDPRFAIFDSDDSQRLMKDVLREANLDSDRYPPARILGRVSDAKNGLMNPEQFADAATGPYDRAVARCYARYQERLREAHALDFDDLIGEAVRLLRESDDAHKYWSDRFLHILVDEFQDVNAAQFEWARLLAQKHRNICVVGDDDQSIYAWRGADVRLILDFELSYSDAKIVRLEQNYRSTQNILDAAHGVISKNIGRKPKKLWTEDGQGAQVQLHGTFNAQEEALWVVKKIQELMRGGEYHPADFALLCRVNAQSRTFEESFMRQRVPLRLVGTQRFYERREIKDLISYLKVLYNPNDGLALSRIINVPARGIGAATIDKLQGLASETGRSLFEIVTDADTAGFLGRAVGQKIAPLRHVLLKLQDDLKVNDGVADVLAMIIERTDYMEFLRREKTVDSVDRQANVQEFLSAAALFDARMKEEHSPEHAAEPSEEDEANVHASADEEAPYLGTFLESVALEGGGDKGDEAGEAVTLMTLHSAKGLEFRVVFLVGMEQGLLPHARALWGDGAGEEDLEEERRLCYVGLTRAREQIFLSYAAQRTLHGRTESTQASQFIDEIPPHLLQRGGLASQGAPRLSSIATQWERKSSSTLADEVSGLGNGATRSGRTSPFGIGDKLKHPKFGEGFVVGVMGDIVEIAFLSQEVGKKKLSTAHAPLQKV